VNCWKAIVRANLRNYFGNYALTFGKGDASVGAPMRTTEAVLISRFPCHNGLSRPDSQGVRQPM